MVIAYKDSCEYGFILTRAFSRLLIHKDTMMNKENIPFKEDNGIILIGSDITMPYRIIESNMNILDSNASIDINIKAIRELLDKYYLINNNMIQGELIISYNDIIYKLDRRLDFSIIDDYKILTCSNYYAYLDKFISMESGNIKDRIINALKKYIALIVGSDIDILIYNNIDKELKLIK